MCMGAYFLCCKAAGRERRRRKKERRDERIGDEFFAPATVPGVEYKDLGVGVASGGGYRGVARRDF